MRLISWNVNGIRAAIKKGFYDFIDEFHPDIICLQETKAHKDQVNLELDKYPYKFWNSAQKKGYSGTAIFSKIKPVDVLVGGFPCQAFSVAGYRKGFKDPRGNLFYEIARFIDELKVKPKALMLENVKNLSGHDRGKTKNAIVKILREFGYSVIWDVYNTADYTNIPQNRERTIIVCFRKEADWDFD